MGESVIPNGGNLSALLKPFYDRISEAEERLSNLESALSKKQGGDLDAGNSELVKDLQSKLEQVTAELKSEQDKVAKLNIENNKLTAENAKKDYRIVHLVRSVTELDLQSK